MSISQNASLAVLPELTPGGFLRPRREQALTRRFMEQLRIKASSPAQVVRASSGGNQQKVVLEMARRGAADPDPRRADTRRRRGTKPMCIARSRTSPLRD
jgi:ribose transport system ATP-binding protein